MDSRIAEKLEQKVDEARSRPRDMEDLADLIGGRDKDSVMAGIVAGRMYNAFCYQTRRILGRDPTPGEFGDFLTFVRDATRKS